MDVLPTGGGTVRLLGSAGIDTFNRGNKFFELANHLGNVLVTVSDRKIGQSPVNNLYTSFTADVVSATDYAPFGMQTPGRSFDAAGSTAYRYGFNGQEKSPEVSSNSFTAEYWQYDTRIGRRWNVDPLDKDDISNYAVFVNNPIAYSDPYGLDTIHFNKFVSVFIPDSRSSSVGKKPTASRSFSIGIVPAKGEDVYIYNNTVSILDASSGKFTETTTSQILHPDNKNSAVGMTKGLNLIFDGLITTERNNYDWESVGKIMDLDKNFYSYMVSRNPNSKVWNERASNISVMEGLMPAAVQSALGAYIGFRYHNSSPNISYLTKDGKYPNWNTVRQRYWNLENGGRVPTGQVIIRIRKTNEVKTVTVSMELHHINGRGGIDPHRYSNLKQVWPWEHEAIDKARKTGYDFLRWVE
jgi:RHS repeat-associated protein